MPWRPNMTAVATNFVAVAKRFVATVVRWFAVAKPPQGRGGNAMVRKQSVHVKGLVVTGVTHIK